MALINADFSQRVLLHADEIAWSGSPMPGVHRRPLDRIGDEVARATSIVRYAPGSRFSSHVHEGGEEFIVLEGVFQDEHGDYPAGSYVRNPPTSRHTPGSETGCVIFVKLWQFDPGDRTFVRVNMAAMGAVTPEGRPGVTVTPLFRDATEDVRVEIYAPGSVTRFDVPGGAELFVLEGSLAESGEELRRQSWLRVPPDGVVDLVAGESGARVWIKSGHLTKVGAPGEGRATSSDPDLA